MVARRQSGFYQSVKFNPKHRCVNMFLLTINFFRGNLSSGKVGTANKQPEQPKVPPKKVEAKKVDAKKVDPKKEATPQRQTSPVKNLKEAVKVRYSDPQSKKFNMLKLD